MAGAFIALSWLALPLLVPLAALIAFAFYLGCGAPKLAWDYAAEPAQPKPRSREHEDLLAHSAG